MGTVIQGAPLLTSHHGEPAHSIPAHYKFPAKSLLSCYLWFSQKLERRLLKACSVICALHSLVAQPAYLFLPLSQNRAGVDMKIAYLFRKGCRIDKALGRNRKSWNYSELAVHLCLKGFRKRLINPIVDAGIVLFKISSSVLQAELPLIFSLEKITEVFYQMHSFALWLMYGLG